MNRDLEFDKRAKALRKEQSLKSNKELVKEIIEKEDYALSENSIPITDFFGISGVYFLFRNSKVVYIGESSCIYSRIAQHFKDTEKEFDSFKFEKIEGSENRKRKEKYLIKKFKPLLNFTHNPSVCKI